MRTWSCSTATLSPWRRRSYPTCRLSRRCSAAYGCTTRRRGTDGALTPKAVRPKNGCWDSPRSGTVPQAAQGQIFVRNGNNHPARPSKRSARGLPPPLEDRAILLHRSEGPGNRPFYLRRMRSVRELAELARDEVGGLLADVDRVIADPLERTRDEDHPEPPFALLGVRAEVEHALDRAAVGAVDQLVEVDERRGGLEIAALERVESDADHLLGPLAHLLERLDKTLVGLDVGDELRQLRDRHAVVAHPLEVQVRSQHREHEPKVDGNGRLPGEQRLDPLLDRQVPLIDLVVEGDHLVGELGVGLLDRIDGRAQRTQDIVALFLEGRFDLFELLLERNPHGFHRIPDYRRLTEPSGDVALRPLIGRLREDLRRLVVLDEDAVAAALGALEREEGGHVGDSRGLLHVVGDDHERVFVLELVHQVLDLRGRNRVECRGGLVEQADVAL